jgi:hypothetical protein
MNRLFIEEHCKSCDLHTYVVITKGGKIVPGCQPIRAVSLCRAISECPLKIPEQPEIIVATEGE